MNIFINKLIFLLILGTTAAYAGDEHKPHIHTDHDKSSCDHPIHKGPRSFQIQEVAIAELDRLVKEKKIPKSWGKVPVAKVGTSYESFQDDWIIVFENPKIKKERFRTLYVFVSRAGNIVGANYTGK